VRNQSRSRLPRSLAFPHGTPSRRLCNHPTLISSLSCLVMLWGIYTSTPWGPPQEPLGGNAIQTATPTISPWSRPLSACSRTPSHTLSPFLAAQHPLSTTNFLFSNTISCHHRPSPAVLMSLDGPSLLSSVPVCLLLFNIPLFPGRLLSGTSDDFDRGCKMLRHLAACRHQESQRRR
jgi:hypothetical protein